MSFSATARRALVAAAVALVAALGIAAAPGTASAAPSSDSVTFGIRPAGPKGVDARTSWAYQQVKAGAAFADYLAVVNVGRKPITLRLYAADGLNPSAGGFDVKRQGDRNTDVGAWVTPSRGQITVPARRTLILPFTVRVPSNAEPGDHAGGIVASYTTRTKDAKGNVVGVESRVGARLYLRVAGALSPQLKVESMAASWKPGETAVSRGSAQVRFTVRNTGNVRLQGTQSIRLSGPLGGSTEVRDVPDLPELLPGNSFTFTATTDRLLPVAFYTAHAVVDPRSVAGNVDPALHQAQASVRFVTGLWPLVGLALLVLAAAAPFAVRFVRRRRGVGGRGGVPPTPTSAPGGPSPSATQGRRIVLTFAAAAVALTSLVLVTGPASATDSGGLTFLPAKGSDIDPMYVVTPAGCPKEAIAVVGTLHGPGIKPEGIVVVPNTTSDVRSDGPFGVPLQDTLQGFAAAEGFRLKGTYRLDLRCIDELGTRTFAAFSGSLSFDEARRYTARAPEAPPAHGVPMGFLAESYPQLTRSPSAAATGPAATVSPVPSPAPRGTRIAAAPASSNDSNGPRPWVGPLVAFVVVALGSVALSTWRRRPVPDGPAVRWPDQQPDAR